MEIEIATLGKRIDAAVPLIEQQSASLATTIPSHMDEEALKRVCEVADQLCEQISVINATEIPSDQSVDEAQLFTERKMRAQLISRKLAEIQKKLSEEQQRVQQQTEKERIKIGIKGESIPSEEQKDRLLGQQQIVADAKEQLINAIPHMPENVEESGYSNQIGQQEERHPHFEQFDIEQQHPVEAQKQQLEPGVAQQSEVEQRVQPERDFSAEQFEQIVLGVCEQITAIEQKLDDTVGTASAESKTETLNLEHDAMERLQRSLDDALSLRDSVDSQQQQRLDDLSANVQWLFNRLETMREHLMEEQQHMAVEEVTPMEKVRRRKMSTQFSQHRNELITALAAVNIHGFLFF